LYGEIAQHFQAPSRRENDRSTAVIVSSAIAAAPKQSKPAANRARAITVCFVMRDDLEPRARFNPPKADHCND